MTFEQVQEHFELASQFRQNGDPTEALRLLLSLVIDLQNDAESKGLLVRVIQACGEVAEAMGDLPQARAHYSRLAGIFYDAGNHYACDYAQLRLARTLTDAGQFEEAEQQIDGLLCQPEPVARIDFTGEGIESWEKRLTWAGQPEPQRRRLILLAWLEIGRCRAMRGQYADAIAALRRALYHCEPDSVLSSYEKPATILELASAYFESGEFPRARDELAKLPGDHADPAVLVLPLEIGSRIDVLEGAPGQAVTKLEKAALICAQTGRSAAANTEELNLAELLISLNQFTRADQYLAAMPPEGLPETDRARREALLRLSDLRAGTVSRGPASAESSTEMWKDWKAPKRHENSGTPFTYPTMAQAGFLASFEARVLNLYALLGDDNHQGAADELARLGRDFGATDSRLVQVRLGYLTGLVAYYGGDLNTARRQFEAGVNGFADMGDLFDSWQALRALGWACVRAGREHEAARHREHSDEILERIADSLGPVEGAIFLLNKWPVVEEHLSRELRRVVEAQKELDNSSRLTAYFRRRGVFQRIDSAMRYIDAHRLLISRSRGLAAKLREYSASAEVARQTSEKPVLRFVVLPDRMVCILVHGSHARILESEVNRAGIRNLVRGFHENIRNFTDKPAKLAEAERTLAQISKAILLTELTGDLPAGTELRLLPDDCLHGVPFVALPLEGGALLGDRFPVSIGSDWQTGERAEDEHPPRSALVMGLSYRDVDDAEPLDGIREELRAVLRQKPFADIAPEPIAEVSVNVAELLRRLPGSDYVHMACHGIFEPDDPSASGLKIYTAETHEVLRVSHLSGLDLRRVRHFTLSSCWGADDYASPGRYIVSLPETILRAGARTVLASLWPVTDAVARDFMPAYYENLAKVSPAEALRLAQKTVRAGEYTGSYAYWAGYRVYTAG